MAKKPSTQKPTPKSDEREVTGETNTTLPAFNCSTCGREARQRDLRDIGDEDVPTGWVLRDDYLLCIDCIQKCSHAIVEEMERKRMATPASSLALMDASMEHARAKWLAEADELKRNHDWPRGGVDPTVAQLRELRAASESAAVQQQPDRHPERGNPIQ